jgi:hypothetical protein
MRSPPVGIVAFDPERKSQAKTVRTSGTDTSQTNPAVAQMRSAAASTRATFAWTRG